MTPARRHEIRCTAESLAIGNHGLPRIAGMLLELLLENETLEDTVKTLRTPPHAMNRDQDA